MADAVNSKSAAVSALGVEWPMVEALMAGTRAMRSAAKTLLPSIAASSDTDIATIRISVGGAGLDTTQDQLLLGTDTLNLSGLARGETNKTIGAGNQHLHRINPLPQLARHAQRAVQSPT
jgi:hypothetical protein